MAQAHVETDSVEAPHTNGKPLVADTIGDWVRGAWLPPELHFVVGFVVPAVALLANMWAVHRFTTDDAYISFRYARNFARGLGLVYNPGERVEGYTNFLWTVILGGGVRLGFDPITLAKVLGAASALGALGMTYVLARRLRPFGHFPCCATWLLATSIVFSGYAVWGLETSLITFLVLAALELFFREEPSMGEPADSVATAPALRHARFPWSALVFGLAGLTRPEAPLFMAIPMLFLGRRVMSRRNLLRAGVFASIVGSHVLFRRLYYGAWLPNSLPAKTGDLNAQFNRGWDYVQNYFVHAGPLVWLSVFGIVVAVETRRRDLLAIAAVALSYVGYVVVVGGDWMPYFRFLSPFEPFAFLLVDIGARSLLDKRKPPGWLAIVAIGFVMFVGRAKNVRGAQRWVLKTEMQEWQTSAGGVVKWLLDQGKPGPIALGDIGYVGYMTDYPVVDLLGLVDPVVAAAPGGYTRKIGPEFTNRIFERAPFYIQLISSTKTCDKPSVPTSEALYNDSRFLQRYRLGGKVLVGGDHAWCIFEASSPAE